MPTSTPTPKADDLCLHCGQRYSAHWSTAGCSYPIGACPYSDGGFSRALRFTLRSCCAHGVPRGSYCPACAQKSFEPQCVLSKGHAGECIFSDPTQQLGTRLLCLKRQPSTLLSAVEKARESARVAELDLRAVLESACSGDAASRRAWLLLYDLIEPLAGIVERLDAVATRLQDEGRGQ